MEVVHDEIFYVDVAKIQPTTPPPLPCVSEPTGQPAMNSDIFSCNGRTNGKHSMFTAYAFAILTNKIVVSKFAGLYPHPKEISQFIGCHSEELTVFNCSPLKRFDPLRLLCVLPEELEHGTSCINRSDGTYPHSNDCSLYVLCRSGSSYPDKCPHPLLFDSVELHCAFPDAVSCHL